MQLTYSLYSYVLNVYTRDLILTICHHTQSNRFETTSFCIIYRAQNSATNLATPSCCSHVVHSSLFSMNRRPLITILHESSPSVAHVSFSGEREASTDGPHATHPRSHDQQTGGGGASARARAQTHAARTYTGERKERRGRGGERWFHF